jgi:hypothetical protein
MRSSMNGIISPKCPAHGENSLDQQRSNSHMYEMQQDVRQAVIHQRSGKLKAHHTHQ